MRKNIDKKAAQAEIYNPEMQDLQKRIDQMDQDERAEADKANQKDAPAKEKKRTFDIKALQGKLQKKEEEEAEVRVIDPKSIKLSNVPAHITESDIREALSKLGGKIEKVYIPPSEGNRNKIALVTYTTSEAADRAIQEKDITLEFSSVPIERALAK